MTHAMMGAAEFARLLEKEAAERDQLAAAAQSEAQLRLEAAQSDATQPHFVPRQAPKKRVGCKRKNEKSAPDALVSQPLTSSEPRKRSRAESLQELAEYLVDSGGDGACVADWSTSTKARKESAHGHRASDTHYVAPDGARFSSKPEVARHFNLKPAPARKPGRNGAKPAATASADSSPLPGVGTRLQIWWDGEKEWFNGEVIAAEGDARTLRYDDGETHEENLREERWRRAAQQSLAPPTAAAVVPESPPLDAAAEAKAQAARAEAEAKAKADAEATAKAKAAQAKREVEAAAKAKAKAKAKREAAAKREAEEARAAAEAHAQAAAQQPAASAGQRMAAMRELLSKWRLDGYADAFDREGYDDVEFLLGMAADKEDLRKVTRAVDMKPGHAAKFIDYVEKLAAPAGLVRGAPAPLALAT
jgi:hypothetical protein